MLMLMLMLIAKLIAMNM